MVERPLDAHPSMYVMATSMTCLEDHVSELERVGRGYLNSRVENRLHSENVARKQNEKIADRTRGRGYPEENKAM